MSEGWIKVHRQICDNEYLWDDKPFARGQAWIDLIMMANHESKTVIIAGKEIVVERGQRITSIRKLQKRWGWSNTKVIDFLNSLQSARMAKIESDAKKTVVTIVNYSFFQDADEKKRQKNDAETTLKHTNKNEKNEKNNLSNNLNPSNIEEGRYDAKANSGYVKKGLRRKRPKYGQVLE